MRRATLLGAVAVVALAAMAVASADQAPGETAETEEARAMPALLGKGLWQVFTALAPRTRVDVHDVGGRDRRVLWPPNWRVCTQYPTEGAVLGRTNVVIGVVKKGESCPLRVRSARR
ncbi:hypothetical protein M5362_08390 [Streptomyces sp. Je 1-79]|uniref:hypothetical protein n=1 Tax=Streptomyces sp. Je 1-79 TaxID=2943847 RepID=UPI0021A2C885|nr:hypothetical protein [Streptomyces sp. Je 1-79]MCT4353146.1 hypothetical protein [Streptomyces sp. Je 1-79]